jgi:hypothetical protein
MAADAKLDPKYLLQEDLIRDFIPSLGREQWQVVYQTTDRTPDSFSVFSGLIPRVKVSAALTHESWDLSIGDGLPGFSQSRKGRGSVTVYRRFGGFDEVRPLVIFRHFHGAWPSYLEICEEFRHFHDLAEDFQRKVFLAFDDSGYPIEVVRVQKERVEIRLSYLLEFLAGTGFDLALFFDVRRFSNVPLGTIAESDRDLWHADSRSRYFRHVRECTFDKEFQTFSRLLGKVVVDAPQGDRCGKWPFVKRDRGPDVSFIIGVGADGTLQEFSSSEERLANYFGANPGVPHYLTPVYFRREVLSKYYADPDRYSISDGGLGCLGLWSMQIDNNHPTHVVAFLGDLGRDLPYPERLHWRQFNVPPEGGVSETNYRRSFMAEFAPPEAVDLVFRSEYVKLNLAWRKAMGWPLFLEPEPHDRYLLETIRVPVTTSQSEFDEQILVLTKLLVDSLNEREIDAHAGPGQAGEKGIAKLERFLASGKCPKTTEVVQFLRDLQSLRSAGAGHRKGTRYHKTLLKFGPDTQSKRELMERILHDATAVLRSLRDHSC